MTASPSQNLSGLASAPADVDLSASQYCGVNLNSTGELVLPSAGGAIIGVLQNDPDVAGKAGTYQMRDISPMKLGGTVAAGDFVKVDSSGRAVTASAGDVAAGAAIGKCLLGGAVNNIGEVQLFNLGAGFVAASGALEIVAAPGAISVVKRTSLLAIDGTDAYTLASGLYAGQRKTIQCSVAANIPAGQITGAFTDTDGTTARTTADFNAVADQLELEWTGSAWQVLLKTSVTMG
jgi:hypothetical protein